jgi:pimeloyl-ACP methyl ester carboxylesterase
MTERLVTVVFLMVAVCSGARSEVKEENCTDGRHKYRIRLPAAYAQDKKRLFQALFTNTPNKGGGFYGMEGWAEKRDVILVAVMDTMNGVDSKKNNAADDAVLESVKKRYRIHPVLKYTMGMSGGGQVSMRFARRHPNEFAGICMLAHGGNGEDWHVPKHQAVAFIHGKKDTVYKANAVRIVVQRMRWRGLSIRLHFGDWGHRTGPLNLREERMDWLMAIAPIIHPKMPSRERVKALKAITERIVGEGTPEERAVLADGVAEHVMRFGSSAKKFYAAWFDAKYALAKDAETDALRFALLSDIAERPWAKACDYKQKRNLKREISKLRKDAAIKREYTARKALRPLQRIEKEYLTKGTTHEKHKELGRLYKKFAEKYGGTVAGERASKIAEFM